MNDETRLSGSDQPTVLSRAGEQPTVLSASSRASTSGRGEDPALEPGQAFGAYRIVRLLGRGGMGEVYEAEHTASGRRVALKLLRGQFDEAGDRARFLQEGRLAASISHPHTVYVFGSEEIDGLPVIAMQLVPGGTLKDRVAERGPMPVSEAVAAVLDIISGLDAAAAAGILHRDVKPSNCFVTATGDVKVGDFGLSISTVAHDRPSGFQGTPQFAPPEQLSDHALDVRADIYAVGATLFYLLTGRAPFDDRDMTTLVERVRTEAPPAAHALQAGIPPALGAVIVRCLAKDREGRPASYTELAAALRPFTATALPARPETRAMAGVVDALLIWLPASLVGVIVEWGKASRGSTSVNIDPTPVVLGLLYFFLCEWRWGATPGKRLFGLRVATVDGRGLRPRIAATRALMFYAGSLPATIAGLAVGPTRLAEWLIRHPWAAGTLSGMPFLAFAILFSTMRARKGYAALHDRLTGTRVILRRTREFRRSDAAAGSPARAAVAVASARSLGVFDLRADLGTVPDGRLFEAEDVTLQRRVWIIERPPGAPEVPKARRDVDRIGRLHWLAGRRDDEAAWDAFEAPDGAPIGAKTGSQPWSRVRLWLSDLAAECAAADADGTLPTLALDRCWSRADGRAVLLDVPAPGATAPGAALTPATFLAAVARIALGSAVGTPMPVSAVTLIDRWTRRPDTPLGDIAGEIAAVSASLDRVTRGRRLVPLLGGAAPLVMMMFAAAIAVSTVKRMTSHDMFIALRLVESLRTERDPARAQAIRTYVSGRFGAVLGDEAAWKAAGVSGTDIRQLRDLAARGDAGAPAERVAAAGATLGATLEKFEADFQKASRSSRSTGEIVVVLLFVGSAAGAAFGLCSVLVRPSGLVLSTMGYAVLTKRGREIGRLRAMARLIVAWSPVILYAAIVAVPAARPAFYDAGPAAAVTAVMLAGVIWTTIRPTRGPHDIVIGTRIGVR